MANPSAETYSRFAEFLTNKLIDRASGQVMRGCAGQNLMLERPADVFFIGSVGPEAAVDEAWINTAPPAMGIEFFTRDLSEIKVYGTFSYFRSEPPSIQICMEAASQTEDVTLDLPIASRKYESAFDIAIQLQLGYSKTSLSIPSPVKTAVGAPAQGAYYRIDRVALQSEAAFDAALGNITLFPPSLTLAAALTVNVTEDSLRGYCVQIRFVNESVNTRWKTTPKLIRRIDRYEEPFLFDVNLRASLGECAIEPTFLDVEASDFRYDNRLWVDGFNTAAEYHPGEGLLRTRYAPIARQKRVKHKVGKEDLRFQTLATDPIGALRALLQEMRAFGAEWAPSKNPDPLKRAAEDLDRSRFEDEVRRFEKGINAIEKDEMVGHAFRAAMNTFAALWQGRDTNKTAAWRRFQIVFIVSVIGGLCGRKSGDHSDLDVVEVLWFPTGGGKTEAYLAIMIWQAFFDRTRGKKAGVTAMMRFPLRLLSLQQMQRVIEAIACAETVRIAEKGFGGEPFTVGFLVGSTVTKNKLTDSDLQQLQEQLRLPFPKRSDWARRHRVVPQCPSCHKYSVDIKIDRGRLLHYCTDSKCAKLVPLLIIDDEVYRYLPTVLVGTIDKLALIGQNMRWRQLLGFVDCKCSIHGYSSGGKCQVYQCQGTASRVQLFDAAPALEIQDELHLLREDLGVVASHYETVAHAIARKYGIAPIKVIASTATIQDHERHTRALYARASRQFPALGPTLSSSFYAETQDYDQRLFVGVMPRRLTHINALMQLMQLEHEVLQSLRNRTLTQPIVPDEHLDTLLDYYEVVVTYTLRRVDQDRVDGSITSQVNPYLVRHGLREIRNRPMTANTTSEEVTEILLALEKPEARVEDRITSLTATSMISHGVDVDRLNLMNFFGMPFSTAEYIQSSSRVGRLVCGCVFVVYQAHKERERSHYQRFLKYHEFQNRLVEPVPLNRWAARGLHFTAPGLVMAAIFALYGDRWTGANRRSLFMAKEVLKAFNQRAFSVADVVASLLDALHVEAADRDETRDFLEGLVREALEQARIADTRKSFGSCMAPEPMQSLRDVEDTFHVDILGPNMWYAEQT